MRNCERGHVLVSGLYCVSVRERHGVVFLFVRGCGGCGNTEDESYARRCEERRERVPLCVDSSPV